MTVLNRTRKIPPRRSARLFGTFGTPGHVPLALRLRPLLLAMAGLSMPLLAQTASTLAPFPTDQDQPRKTTPALPAVDAGGLVPRLAEPQGSRNDDSQPTFVSADKMTGIGEQEIQLEGHGEVRRGGSVVKGDRLIYNQDRDEATAHGNVRLSRDGALFVGPQARYRVDASEGTMQTPNYYFQQTGGSGRADRIDFIDADHASVQNATYTTCTPDNADWYFRASRLDFDTGRQVGTGYNGSLHFFGVPILAAPVFTFPLSDERRSGVLAPVFGFGSRNGLDLTVPYYFNLAPNRDLTLYPRLMSRRGAQLGAEFRYLGNDYSGQWRGEFLPNDRQLDRDRWSYSIQHQHNLLPGMQAYVNLNRVSDARYPDDMGRTLSMASQRQYVQEGGVNYTIGDDWAILARVQKFQVLPPSLPSYEREPQLNVRYTKYNLGGFDISVESDYTRFTKPLDLNLLRSPEGERMFIQPSISYPIVRAGWFITPKASFNAASYRLDHMPVGAPRDITRTVPTFSIDSGMTFERDAPGVSRLFGRNFIQTLEPRLFYVYTPFREQSQIPLFDTAESDFGMGQIFSENPFTGYDRIADNNKVTVGVTTRLIEAETGIERFRGTIAQRVDLNGQRVSIAGTTVPSDQKYSDLLLGATVQLFRNYYFDTGIQYNREIERVIRSNIALAWKPGPRQVVNVGYRYRRGTTVLDNNALEQFELSGQWPITQRLYGIGRVNYDMNERTMTDTLAGFEYDADCWVGRLAYQRYRNTAGSSTSQIFAQIEFKGFSKIGNNPIDVIKLNVPGYQPVPARQVTPSILDQYE